MSNKFLDKTGLTHFWGNIKTLLAGKADSSHTHDSFDGNLYVGGVLDADAGICIGGEPIHEIFAEANHTHDFEYLSIPGNIATDSDLEVEGTIYNQGVDLNDLYAAKDGLHQFKIMTRKTATTNGAVDLSSYINNTNYSELMIIVRTQATAAVTLGISNTTNATTSNFIASKSLSNGISYTKIMLEKTDEGYYMWDVNGSIGFSNDATYKYIRNYSATSNAVTSMSIVIHGR